MNLSRLFFFVVTVPAGGLVGGLLAVGTNTSQGYLFPVVAAALGAATAVGALRWWQGRRPRRVLNERAHRAYVAQGQQGQR